MSAPLQVELDGALGAVLDDMQQALAELAGALEAERQALLAGDVAAIDATGTRKQALMQALERLDAERVQLSAAAPQAAEALESRWQASLRQLQACRDLNLRNGGIVNQRLGSVRRALAILTGQDGDAGVYGPRGAVHSTSRSRHTLAEA